MLNFELRGHVLLQIGRYMRLLRNIVRFFEDPNLRFSYFTSLGLTKRMSDKDFLIKKFKLSMHMDLNLDNPQTFNEKLQWLKLYNRKQEYITMVDKYAVRGYIKEKLGEEYLIPLIAMWNSPDEIDFNLLPNQFVLKCNHNSGLGMYICKDKSKLTANDTRLIRKNLARGLAQDYFLTGREWPYRDVPRKILCENYMTDSVNSSDFTDYKFFLL